MHEISIANSILSIASSAIPCNNNAMVSAIGLQIGELAGIEIESLKFAFSIIRANTLLQNAELNIKIIKGEAICNECETIFPFRDYGTGCPKCSSYSMKIIKGRELQVLNIIVEE